MDTRTDNILESLDLPPEVKDSISGYRTAQGFWENCRRADWMVQVLERSNRGSRRGLRHYLAALARRLQMFFPDVRCTRAVDVADSFADGDATQGAVKFILQGAEKAAEEAVEAGKVVTAYAARLSVLTLRPDVYAALREAIDLSVDAAMEVHESDTESLILGVLSEMADLLREFEPAPFSE